MSWIDWLASSALAAPRAVVEYCAGELPEAGSAAPDLHVRVTVERWHLTVVVPATKGMWVKRSTAEGVVAAVSALRVAGWTWEAAT